MFQQLGAAAPPSLSVRAVEVPGLDTDIVAVAAGAEHTCALTLHGGVKCWGGNAVGQLGDGTKTSSAMPVDVIGLGSGVAAISAGSFHTCALMAGSGLKCWGSNFDGRLGDGTTTDSSSPVNVVSLASGVGGVSAGYVDTCAVTSAGGVKCWGSASYGVLGMAASSSTSPIDLAGLTRGVAQVGVGTWHGCAVMLSDGVKCWGTLPESYGSAPRETLPADVTGLRSGVVQLAVGQTSTCILTASGAVQCWGAGDLGQLGNGNLASSSVPVDVVGLGSGVVAVSVGSDYACAAMVAGSVQCWGVNEYGQLGDGSKSGSIGSSVPTPVIGF
jgi:alpha-tubulin suppressor-like RCC1 family protein